MKQKYNLALIPKTKSADIIAVANKLQQISFQYCLAANKALPHLTLYQFHAEPDELQAIWEQVTKTLHPKSIHLTFQTIGTATFDDKTLHWISLLPDQRETLFKMHALIARIIKHHVKENFDPHMTLLNTKDENYLNLAETLTTTIEDEFIISLGRSDKIGQYLEILRRLG